VLAKLTDTVKGIFSRKQASDDARFADVHEAVTTIAGHVQTSHDNAEARFPRWKRRFPPLRRT
jgi:hypothetical protein